MIIDLKDKNIDTVLVMRPEAINEDDSRSNPQRSTNASDWGTPGFFINPKYWGNGAFGSNVQRAVSGLGQGYWCNVTDFKKCIVVETGYHNTMTGRAASKTFLIMFEGDDGGNGIVMSTMSKWRTISGWQQAASYISSVARSLKDQTGSAM